MRFDDTTTVYIPLWKKDGTVRAWAAIDTEDLSFVFPHHWFMSAKGYAARHLPATPGGITRLGYLHRDLYGLPYPSDGREVDHRDRDRLNNRRSNTRLVTHRENSQNVPLLRNNTSGYRGVSLSSSGRWRAYIYSSGKQYHLGTFCNVEDAATAASSARRNMFPGYEG